MADVEALVAALRRAPRSSADELIRGLGLGSQPTFSRLVARAGERVVAIGSARARRYAAARPVRGLGYAIPLFRVDASGRLTPLGELRPCERDGCAIVAASGLARWLRGPRGDGGFDGWPPFVADQRPAGFLGAVFANRHRELALAPDPASWSDDDALLALATAGEDMPGDIVIGEASAQRFYAMRAHDVDVVAAADRPRRYAALADEAIRGVVGGASASGEQPKFGAVVGRASSAAHALVKFSPAEYSPAARRWCDLLVAEHLALDVLRANGVPAVESTIVEGGARVFLEAIRFDREEAWGRRAVVTLAAMAATYAGPASSCAAAVTRLAADRWVAQDVVAQVRRLDAYAAFIANPDRALGDVAFLPRDDGALDLAPAYDLLPMAYAPVAGEVPARTFVAPLPEPGHASTWLAAGALAVEFWRRAAGDDRISRPFQAIAAANLSIVTRALARFEGG